MKPHFSPSPTNNPPANGGAVTRRGVLKGLSSATLCAAAWGNAPWVRAASPSARRPNVVFVFSDEHRWCSLPFTEMPELLAPNLSRLSRQGTRLDNCCSTSPICTPYRAMLLTGLWPNQSTYYSNDTFIDFDFIGKKTPSIAQTFNAAGYRTGYVGKWHLNEDTVYQAGFDYFKHWLYGDNHLETQMRDVPSRGDYQTIKGYNAIGMTDQAIEFIKESAPGAAPFMLMLSLNPPHWRWDDAPEEFYRLYPPEKLPFRPNVTAAEARTGKFLEYYRHYHAHITAVDREVGRIMAALDQAGVADDTIFVYTSDHGSSFGSNGVFNKGNPFDESVRVPFLIRWPGRVKAGAVAPLQLGTIDIYPTLCGLVGIRPPDQCAGQDLSAAVQGRPGPSHGSQLLMINNFARNYFNTRLDSVPQRHALTPFRGVRTARHTFAVDPLGEWLLFDNIADPYQLSNRVSDPAYADIKAGLQAELRVWLARAEDPFIPESWRLLSLPERIARGNEVYTLMTRQREIDAYRSRAMAPFMERADTEQRTRFMGIARDVFSDNFFGLYFALHNPPAGEVANRLNATERAARLTAWESEHQARFSTAISTVLAD